MLALAANKSDLPGTHTVSAQEGQMLAKRCKIPVFGEISAKSKDNLDRFFLNLATACYENRDKFVTVERGTFALKNNPRPQEKKKCC